MPCFEQISTDKMHLQLQYMKFNTWNESYFQVFTTNMSCMSSPNNDYLQLEQVIFGALFVYSNAACR